MIENSYIASVKYQFMQYKTLAEKAIDQIPDDKIYWQCNPESNSIAMIVKHMAGNMRSRFTDFYSSDGEKKWRNRDAEFENEKFNREQLKSLWNSGWNCLFNMLKDLKTEDLTKTVLIRNEEHTVMEAINRQLTHYAYHAGQIVFISKMVVDNDWKTLSIAKDASRAFNSQKGL